VAPAGGYQKPSKPAAVSGPGSLSARTDGQPGMALPDAQYGEAAQFAQDQAGAPMAQAPSPTGSSPVSGPRPAPPGFSDPTQQPDVPVTAGAAAGPGPGPEALGFDAKMSQGTQELTRYLPFLTQVANDPHASDAARGFVAWLQSKATAQGG